MVIVATIVCIINTVPFAIAGVKMGVNLLLREAVIRACIFLVGGIRPLSIQHFHVDMFGAPRGACYAESPAASKNRC